MSAVDQRKAMDETLREITERVLESADHQYTRAAEPEGSDPMGNHAFLAYLNWLSDRVEQWREITLECIEEPPDATGNPWPDCICNDARYVLGHMLSCPAHGQPADTPKESSE